MLARRASFIDSSDTLQVAAATLLLIAAWQAGAAAAGSPHFFPGPVEVLAAMIEEARSGALAFHLGMTVGRVVASFVLAFGLGVALGVAMGRSHALDLWLRPWMVLLLNAPALVIVILCYLWFGLDEFAVILAVALSKIPSVAVTLREGARALGRDYDEVAQVYRFGPGRTVRHVFLPQLVPYLLGAARNGLALIWKIVLLAELLGRSNGAGFQLQVYFQLFDVARVMAYAIAFVAVIAAIELGLMAPLERRAHRWRR
jgi:NitT/TauT family transport system permease protein